MTEQEAWNARLTGAGTLTRNVGLNLVGVLAPLVLALAAVPALTTQLGEARFGLLSLSWLFIGYFNVFDLGFGRALTRLVSARLAAGQSGSVAGAMMTALLTVSALSIVVAVGVVFAAPTIVDHALNVDGNLRDQALMALIITAVTVPFVVAGTVMRGLLEAYQRFDLVNLVRIGSGTFLFGSPLIVLSFTDRLDLMLAVLCAGKIVGTLFQFRLCRRVVPELGFTVGWDRGQFRALIGFGGWITLGNLLAPLLLYIDQFLIGSAISLEQVGYYVVPHQGVTKAWVVVFSLTAVLFPALTLHLQREPPRAIGLLSGGLKLVALVLTPLTLLMATGAPLLLNIWLGPEFARVSAPLVQVFAIAVLVNSFSIVLLSMVEASNRPDLVPKLFLVELVPYIALQWWVLHAYGLMGAAVVWLLKVVVDFLFLAYSVRRVLPSVTTSVLAVPAVPVAALTLIIVLGLQMSNDTARFGLGAMAAVAFAAAQLKFGLDEVQRSFITLAKSRARELLTRLRAAARPQK